MITIVFSERHCDRYRERGTKQSLVKQKKYQYEELLHSVRSDVLNIFQFECSIFQGIIARNEAIFRVNCLKRISEIDIEYEIQMSIVKSSKICSVIFEDPERSCMIINGI